MSLFERTSATSMTRGCVTVAAVGFATTGCLPAGVFSSARSVPRGELEHAVTLELPLSFPRDDVEREVPSRPARLGTNPAPLPAYGLRVGVWDRTEVSGKLAPTSLELAGKWTFVDAETVAVAVAPRVTSAGYFPADGPYYVRLPLLFTWEPSPGWSLTPRLGAAVVTGPGKRYDGDFERAERGVRNPLFEGGATLLVPMSPRVSIALEGYALVAPWEDASTPRWTGGIGFGVLFASASRGRR